MKWAMILNDLFSFLQELMSHLNVWNFDIFNLDILTGGTCVLLHVAVAPCPVALTSLFDCYAAF